MAINTVFRGSVVGKASTIGIEFLSTPPQILTAGWVKNAKFGIVFNITQFEPSAFENAARYPNSETNFLCKNDFPLSSPSLVNLGPRTPDNRLSVLPYP